VRELHRKGLWLLPTVPESEKQKQMYPEVSSNLFMTIILRYISILLGFWTNPVILMMIHAIYTLLCAQKVLSQLPR
jgi:hypothetical protein